MSWMSPLTVPITTLPTGGMPHAVRIGSRIDIPAFIARAEIRTSGTKIMLSRKRIPTTGMTVVGIRFRDNIIFVPEVLISARAMKAGMAILEPILTACGIPPVGKVVMGTVKGDIHDIGKNLVGMMLKGAGFQVHDLGVNVNLAKFQAAIEQHQPDLIGMSALLTTTMGQMKINIEAFDKAGLFSKLRVMGGGAPVSPDYAKATGAHGYGKDAASAVELALS